MLKYPEYKQKELKAMQTKCLNPDYKQQKTQAKQVKSLNADYKKWRQKLRKSSASTLTSNKETEAMQAKHQNTYHKAYKGKVAHRHKQVTSNKNHRRNLTESINIFHPKIQYGCIVVCSVCQQTNLKIQFYLWKILNYQHTVIS